MRMINLIILLLLANNLFAVQGKEIYYDWSPQTEILADENLIDGKWGLVGFKKGHTSFHIDTVSTYKGNSIYQFWASPEANRIELTECFTLNKNVKGYSQKEMEHLKTIKDVYGIVSCGDYGDTISYTWYTRFPEPLNTETRGIFAQWHGRPDRTIIKTPQGKIKKLSISEFIELSGNIEWKSFKDNEGGVRGIDKKSGKETGYIVDGSAGGPIGAFSIGDGYMKLLVRNDPMLLSKNSRPKLKPSIKKPIVKIGERSGALIFLRPVKDIPMGEWIHFKVVIQYSDYSDKEDKILSDGFVKLWINGKLETDWIGNIGKNDSHGPYFKFGIYKPGEKGFKVHHCGYNNEILKKGRRKTSQERVLLNFKANSRPPKNWKTEGYAFGTHQPKLKELQRAAVASRNQRYSGTGRMTSPEFKIESDYLYITCSGTFHPTQVAIVLIVDGKDVRSCSPEPGYGFLGYQLHQEKFKAFMSPDTADYVFDVRSMRGKKGILELRDNHHDGWLEKVKITASDQKPSAETKIITSAASWVLNRFETGIKGDFLLIPVGPLKGTPLQSITVEIDQAKKLVVDQPLAFGSIETVGYLPLYDLSGYQGKKLKVSFHSYNKKESSSILVQNDIPGRVDSDQRPAFHIHNRFGLLNDPNGLVYHNGEYHLFHQYNYNVSHLDWAHYVSKDLMHWKERPFGLFHDSMGSMHSGSAAVDVMNTSGWQQGKMSPLILAYTASLGNGGNDKIQTQCLAYSTDKGKTFTKYKGNPIIGQDQRFIKPEKNSSHARDPKIFWYSATQGRNPNAKDGYWVMILFEGNGHTIYTSPDLKKWEKHGSIKGFHECPELFPLAVDGDPTKVKWIMYGAKGKYHIGSFNGKEYKPETEKQTPMFYDGRCYASQTFNNTTSGWGGQPRRIQVAWQGGRKGQISLPNELTLRTTSLGLRVCLLPVKEIKNLYQKVKTFDGLVLEPGQANPFNNLKTGLYDIELEADLSRAKQLILNIRGKRLVVDVTKTGLSLGKRMKIPGTKKLSLRVVVDNTSQDIYFGEHGLYYSPRMTQPNEDKSLTIEIKGTKAVFEKCRVRELKSIW